MIQPWPHGDFIDRATARARRAWAQLRAVAAPAAQFGSPASMTMGAALGVVVFGGALAGWSAGSAPASAARMVAEQAAITMTQISAPAPVGAPPPPPVQLALDYDVVFFWPKSPQTVAEAVAIREGPAEYAKAIRSARPGERLRINGRVEAAPDGPWMRVRLEDGRDGYFAGETIEVAAFRRRRAEEPAAEAAPALEDPQVHTGAPLIVAGPASEPDGPPSF